MRTLTHHVIAFLVCAVFGLLSSLFTISPVSIILGFFTGYIPVALFDVNLNPNLSWDSMMSFTMFYTSFVYFGCYLFYLRVNRGEDNFHPLELITFVALILIAVFSIYLIMQYGIEPGDFVALCVAYIASAAALLGYVSLFSLLLRMRPPARPARAAASAPETMHGGGFDPRLYGGTGHAGPHSGGGGAYGYGEGPLPGGGHGGGGSDHPRIPHDPAPRTYSTDNARAFFAMSGLEGSGSNTAKAAELARRLRDALGPEDGAAFLSAAARDSRLPKNMQAFYKHAEQLVTRGQA